MNDLVMNTKNIIKTEGQGSEKYTFAHMLANNTLRAYKTDLKLFFDVKDIKYITTEMIENKANETAIIEFISSLVKKGRKSSTINRRLTGLSTFYRYIIEENICNITENPFRKKKFRLKVDNKTTTRCLTREEIALMLKNAKDDNELITLRNQVILLLFGTIGFRNSELRSIKVGDITENFGGYQIKTIGKGGKPRFVKLSKVVKGYIDEYLSLRGLTCEDKNVILLGRHTTNSKYYEGNTPLSATTIGNIIKDIAKKSGLDAKDISPHSFRHAFITEHYKEGKDIKSIQEMAGHSNIQTTMRYIHSVNVIKDSIADDLANSFIGNEH